MVKTVELIMAKDISIHSVATALKEGNKTRARKLVKALLQRQPSADAWFLAAHATDNDKEAIRCLKEALKLDTWHVKANRMLLELEASRNRAVS